MIRYKKPRSWMIYDPISIATALTNARAAMLALSGLPFQRTWAIQLQELQLKREVAGTSRIEGAEFTDLELDRALATSGGDLQTRSQRQAAAAVTTYRWLAGLPTDLPLDLNLILQIHARMVRGCDDDHCPPGKLRTRDQNVSFGSPPHRGVEGGTACAEGMENLSKALVAEFPRHDPLVQALALHYHFAAMHPFLDGNGRTARALEALLLQRVGLRDTLFIAMSNYYYEEKNGYLGALAAARANEHDLTPFLLFGLAGIEKQCRRLFDAIRHELAKALFRNTMTDLFGRLRSPKKRIMSARHVQLLNLLLDSGPLGLEELATRSRHLYRVKESARAFSRDLGYLVQLRALSWKREDAPSGPITIGANLEWPTVISESEFLAWAKSRPKGKQFGFLSN